MNRAIAFGGGLTCFALVAGPAWAQQAVGSSSPSAVGVILASYADQVSRPDGGAGVTPTSAEGDAGASQLGDIVVTARRVSERLQDIPASVTAVGSDQVARSSSLESLQSAVSGLTFKNLGPVIAVGLRGFGNRPATQGPNNAVGIFQDGVFIAPFLNGLASRIDVARIEVAKGPQGTLYGRSTYAGAINIVTNDPTSNLSGYLDVGAGGSSARKEFLWHARGVLSGPITDTLSARIFLLREKRDGFTYDLNTNKRGFGYDRIAGRIKLKWEPSQNLLIRLAGTLMHDNAPRGVVHLESFTAPLGGKTNFGNPNVRPVFVNGPDIWATNIPSRPSPGKVNGQEVTLDTRLQTSVGELAFLTDYTHSDTNIRTPSDPSLGSVVDADTISDEKRFSQEIRLSGKEGGFSYLAGLYYLYTNFNFGKAGDTLDLTGTSARFFPGSAPYDLANTQAQLTPTETKTKAYAAFLQMGYDITDRLNLTVGIRQSRDNLSGTTQSATLLRTGAVVQTVPKTFRKAEFNATTGSATLSYKLSPGSLAYASFSRGDAPGGFNNGAAAAINFVPQKVDAYELGVKSELLDRRIRLNLAFFNNDYTDLQFFQGITINGVASQVTLNAAKARGRGIDIDGAFILSPNLRANIQYTHQTSKITSYVVPPAPAPQISYDGVALVRSPKHSLNASLTYSQDIGPGKFQFTAEESYTSSYNNDYLGVPAGTRFPQGPALPGQTAGVTTTQVLALFRSPGYAITNLNASYAFGNWEVSGYVRNLFNRQYVAYANSFDAFTYPSVIPGEPRTFELSVKYSF